MQPTIQNSADVQACQGGHIRSTPRAALWADNPDVTADLQFLFNRSGLHLNVVMTAEGLLEEAAHAQARDVLVIDCTTASDALERCLTIATRVTAPLHICHPVKEFIDDLQAVARAKVIWLPPEYTGVLLLGKLRLLCVKPLATADDTPQQPLTIREQEVLRLVAVGLTNPNIADRLYVSESTVKTHVAKIKQTLGRTTCAQTGEKRGTLTPAS